MKHHLPQFFLIICILLLSVYCNPQPPQTINGTQASNGRILQPTQIFQAQIPGSVQLNDDYNLTPISMDKVTLPFPNNSQVTPILYTGGAYDLNQMVKFVSIQKTLQVMAVLSPFDPNQAQQLALATVPGTIAARATVEIAPKAGELVGGILKNVGNRLNRAITDQFAHKKLSGAISGEVAALPKH